MKKSASFVLTLLFTAQALAIVEFDVGYSAIYSNSGTGNWTYPSATFSGAGGLEGDLRFNFPMSDWEFGLRYTNLTLNASSGSNTLAMTNTATSGLLGYRLINTFFLLGPVVTYAFTNSGTLQNSMASTGSNSATAGSVQQYTAGIEAGIKFPILLSVEAGYGYLSMSNFTSNQTLNGNPTTVSLAGTYGRASIGFAF